MIRCARLAAGRGDEDSDVKPLEAVMTSGDRPLAHWRLNPANDRLQPDAVLVSGEHLDRTPGMARPLFGDRIGEFFYMPPPAPARPPSDCAGGAPGSTSHHTLFPLHRAFLVQQLARRVSRVFPDAKGYDSKPGAYFRMLSDIYLDVVEHGIAFRIYLRLSLPDRVELA